MDSFTYDRDTGLAMHALDRQTSEEIVKFEKEDDDENVKGDSENVEG